jgi:predicted DNA-binding transcriptional regulator AlpA
METCTACPPILIDIREASRLLGIAPRTIDRLIERSSFPEPVRLGRAKRWRLTDIEGYVHELAGRR